MARIRVIFMGSAQLSCPSLQGMMEVPFAEMVAAVTQPDRPKGRDLKLQPTPVKELADRAGLPVLQPARARAPEFIGQIRELRPDLIVVAAYGQILPKDLLEVPRYGCVNLHTSLLPKYRGAAPIQWAILNGDPETGVTIMKMDEGLDTGGILAQQSTPISGQEDAQTLHDRLAGIGARLLITSIPPYVEGRLAATPQPAVGVSYAAKIKKQDGLIDWRQNARTIWNKVRGLVPWPCAFTFIPGEPKRLLLKIWRAEVMEQAGPPGEVLQADKGGIVIGAESGALRIHELQQEGGRRLPAKDFAAGHSLKQGMRLG